MRSAIGIRCEEVRTQLLAKDDTRLRKTPEISDTSYEIDVAVPWRRLDALAADLEGMGFAALRTPAQRNHRFYMERNAGGWGKIDVKLTDRAPTRNVSDVHWLLRRRRGVVVAFLGPDGSGKSTIIAALERRLPLATFTLYMGRRRRSSSSVDLQSTTPSTVRRTAGLLLWVATHLLRVLSAEARAWRGNVVLCDRHPLEAGLVPNDEPGWVRAAKRFTARRLLPKPDHVIVLAAPVEVLLERKREHRAPSLEMMAGSLSTLADDVGGLTISTDRRVDAVVDDVEEIIWNDLIERRRN